MSDNNDNQNKHNENNSKIEKSVKINLEETRNYSNKIGDSKAQQDKIQKGGEITPKPNPPKNNDEK